MQIVPEYMFYLAHIFRYTDRIKQGFLDILRSAGLAFWSKEVQKIKQKLLCPRKVGSEDYQCYCQIQSEIETGTQ